MAKEKKERFILELELLTDDMQEDILNKRMEIARRIYNQCVSKTQKQYQEMIKTKRYRTIQTELRKIQSEKEEGNKTKTPREKELYQEQNLLYREFGFSEFGMGVLAIKQGKAFSRHLDSTACQNLGVRLWQAWDKFLFHDGESVHFRKYGKLNSISGVYNHTGITIRKKFTHPSWEGERLTLVWGRTSRNINLVIRIKEPKNDYEKEALENEIANSRIVRRTRNGKTKFYVQIVLKGTPPIKTDKSGEILHPLGRGEVNIKLNTQSVIVSKNGVDTKFELAKDVQPIEDEMQEVERALTRSRIATNPDKYNADGTAKKLPRNKLNKWKRSKRYLKLKNKKQSLYGKQADVRKMQHEILANTIVSMGDTFIVTHPDFKKKQKDNGKTIANRAPAEFLDILKRKVAGLGGTITTCIEE